MATEKQINANRKNAQKSIGPKTDEGKAAVSQNAVKHGLFAQSVIKGENEAAYEAFHDKMVAEMKPVGPMEILLVERIVSLWWRLERAERIQNQAIDVMIERDEPSPLEKSLQKWMPKDIGPDTRGAGPEMVLGRAIIKDFANSRVLDKLMLYERRIENSLHKTMRELERLQLIRQLQQQEAEQEIEPEQTIPSTALRACLEPVERTGPIPINNDRDEAATRPNAEKSRDLKKQSQFVPDLNGAKSYLKVNYDKNPLRGAQQNKANLSLRERTQSRAQADIWQKAIETQGQPIPGSGTKS